MNPDLNEKSGMFEEMEKINKGKIPKFYDDRMCLETSVPDFEILKMDFWRERINSWSRVFVFKTVFNDKGHLYERFSSRICKDEGFPSVRESLLQDCFQWAVDPENTKYNQETGKIEGGGTLMKMSMVHDHWSFWDAILSTYLSANPELFKGEKEIANAFLNAIEEDGFDPLKFQNMCNQNWEYIRLVAQGKVHLKFLRHPMLITIVMCMVIKAELINRKLTMEEKLKLHFDTAKTINDHWEEVFDNFPMKSSQKALIKRTALKYADEPEEEEIGDAPKDKNELRTLIKGILEQKIKEQIEEAAQEGESDN